MEEGRGEEDDERGRDAGAARGEQRLVQVPHTPPATTTQPLQLSRCLISIVLIDSLLCAYETTFNKEKEV